MINDDKTYAIIGAAQNVHGELGYGFLEPVYQEALACEFDLLNIPYKKEVEIPIFYKGKKLDKYYKADFICFDSVVVELKALQKLSGTEISQVINYLKATKIEKGLLLNFGNESLEQKRILLNQKK